jgi:LytS/YehU family sensor histidine kinase
MSLQILIENAVKHNKVSKGKPLYIDISCNLEEEKIIVSNNVQYKELASTTGKGLNHLNKKFELLNLPHLEVIKDEETFCVQIPLIKTLSYESLDY